MTINADDNQVVYNKWEALENELDRTLWFIFIWLDINMKSEVFRNALAVLLFILILWGILIDPRAVIAGAIVGLTVGLLIWVYSIRRR